MNDCQICGCSEYISVCLKDHIEYVKCINCASVRQHPYPDANTITEYYKDYKSIKGLTSDYLDDASYDAYKKNKLFTFDDLNLNDKYFIDKSILDVGCGTGQFVHLINTITNQKVCISGIDVSEQCITIARTKGLNCQKKDFFDVSETFDLICMFHVVEHLYDPKKYFEHAHASLKNGGNLLIETPIIGVVSDVFAHRWRYYIANEHINLFTPEALINMASLAGFETLNSTRFGSGIDSNGSNCHEKRAIDRIAKRLGWGDTFAVLFRKK
jgi:2-polyprenyl-3-methyl-5-hydroxy-6-metoxy-1,4-benzoquinol methylase